VISGTVSSDVTGTGLAEVCVEVVNESGGSFGGDLTGPDGSYFVAGLPEGARYVGFEDCLFDAHGPEWFDDVPIRTPFLSQAIGHGDPVGDGADPVQVELATEISGIDAVLSPQGIAGTVTDSVTGQPIEGCEVEVWGEEVDGVRSGRGTFTGPDGTYDFESLPVADVQVVVFCGPGYLREWYLDRQDAASADTISIQPRSVIAGIDLAVDRDVG
jgi:carboxypeptidase family protein